MNLVTSHRNFMKFRRAPSPFGSKDLKKSSEE
jgi:hypothetical protein